MDANLWKLLVNKVILRTKSRDLLWQETNEGPDNTLSFGTSIDGSTTLNIWGYKTNYSYELCLTKETTGDPFVERKRVTAKKNAEGIDFKGLFETVQLEIEGIIRDRAFAGVMEYLADPTVEDPEKKNELCDKWGPLGDDGFFLYSQDEKILGSVRDMTAAGSITWSAEQYSGGDAYFHAEIGDLLYVRLQPAAARDRVSDTTSYQFEVAGIDDNFYAQVDLHPNKQGQRPLWLIAQEIHAMISKKFGEDEAKFNKIVRDNIVHDILASLDNPRMEPSSLEGN